MRSLCIALAVLIVPSLANAQVSVTGTYSDLVGDALPLISARNLRVTVFDDNGNPIPSQLTPVLQQRPTPAGTTDQYTLTFNAPVVPNRTVSLLFQAPGREDVRIPRVLASGQQELNVVLPKQKVSCQPRRCFCGCHRRRCR